MMKETFTKWLTEALGSTKRQEENLLKKLDDARITGKLAKFWAWNGEELHECAVHREVLEMVMGSVAQPQVTPETIYTWANNQLIALATSEPQSTSLADRRAWTYRLAIMASIVDRLNLVCGR